MNTPLTDAPRLTTERLILRGPLRTDLPHLTRFVTSSPEMAALDELGSDRDAWRTMQIGIGHWQWHGYGFFTLQTHEDPTPLGRVGILNHVGWERPELAWHLFEGATGKGYATEAGRAIRTWAARTHGLVALVSNIATQNTLSQAVARRLMAINTGARATHEPSCEIWAHPEITA